MGWMDDDYDFCVKACEREGVACPSNEEFLRTVANTPAWVRAYFYEKGFTKGYEKALRDNDILYGENKERFLKETGLIEKGECEK